MFSVCLRHADQMRLYFVSRRTSAGWEVKSAENNSLTRHVRYHDWHRVERIIELFRREVADLTAQGWQVQSTNR